MSRILKEEKNKHINRLYARYQAGKVELEKKYHVRFAYPRGGCLKSSIDDIEGCLILLNEVTKLHDSIFRKGYNQYLKYVKGGGRYFKTCIKKKERRRALPKFRNLPISYYQQIYKEELSFIP